MKLFSKLAQVFRSQARPASSRRTKLQVENLESRLVPHSVSGDSWVHPELVTLSFVPDGTDVGGVTSDLQSTFDNHASASFQSGWRNQILKAAQVWAQQTNLNFAVVNDNGAPIGSGDYQQGDPNFGDIRFGGFNFGSDALGQAYMPPQTNNYSVASDIQFNTGQTWNIGSTYDLFTVAVHEIGHALGVEHGALGSVMQSTYPGTKTALATDDTNGIRSIYGTRSKDSYDLVASNGSFDTASSITSLIDGVDLTALLTDRDITTTADVDYYSFQAPEGASGTMTVTVQSSGLSLLAPQVKVYSAETTYLLNLLGIVIGESETRTQVGSASGLNQYGTSLTVTIDNVTPGQKYYVMVDGADNTAFGTGKYALSLNFGTGSSPAVPLPDTLTANGSPLSNGGAEPIKEVYQAPVSQNVAGTQQTGKRAVAMDANGNYVATWESWGQDGLGYGIYARRFDAAGNARGNEFRVNTTTFGDQHDPAVAMDDAGNFVITWSNFNWLQLDQNVHAQRYNAAGVAQGGEMQVVNAAGIQSHSRVAVDAAGNFVIAWESMWGLGDNWADVYARRYSAAGTALAGAFRVNSTTSYDQKNPDVAVDPAGNVIIVWSSEGQDGSEAGVYGRRYNAQGLAQGGEFRVNVTTAEDQQEPTVSTDAAGNFVVSWSSDMQDGSGKGVFVRRFNALGAAQDGEIAVNTHTLYDQQSASVAMDDLGNFVVTWSSWMQDGGGWGVYARQFNSDGTAAGDELLVNLTTEGDQKDSSVALKRDSEGHTHCAIVWSGNGNGDTYGVFGRLFEW